MFKNFFVSKINGLIVVALLIMLSVTGVVRAEDTVDPPRVQKAGNFTVEFVSPKVGEAFAAETEVEFHFRVTDASNQAATGLRLNLTALRDYSGQVKKEHNGPRTPNIGPVALQETANGDYTATLRFGQNGHWFIQVDGASLNGKVVKFRTPIAVAENKGAGINLDWLTWPALVLTVIGLVVFTGRKGEIFPTPYDELEPPVPAQSLAGDTKLADELVASKQ